MIHYMSPKLKYNTVNLSLNCSINNAQFETNLDALGLYEYDKHDYIKCLEKQRSI